ncbi:DgyrCDS12719 [Dimorphilus gyrociliatus]|uniref:DgyrCDS12719 n=1 Tax=Dimorphilus gyrociliatus TaxID=2664684 RepID=A0A7I8W7D1_9ANNE|nr:DgyrCDS12719 [Dimorphilus gyrociliatus]
MSSKWKPATSDLSDRLLGIQLSDIGDSTKVISSKLKSSTRAVEPIIQPIYHSAIYKISSVDDYLKILEEDGFIYGRLCNPSCQAVEVSLASLEDAYGSLTFSSGMGAISTIFLECLKANDHIVCQYPLYSGTFEVLKKLMAQFNVSVSWLNSDSDMQDWEAAIKPNTVMLYGETPCNPIMSILDLIEFAALGKKRGILTVVDATFGSPVLFKPLNYGIDIVLHSATKYIGGHSDVIAGVLSTRNEKLWSRLLIARSLYGTILSPHEASLLLRGLKTLPLRMKKHTENAREIAEYLDSRKDKVSNVLYPGLRSHAGHKIIQQQMPNGCGGMMSFEMKDGLDAAVRFIESVRVIHLGVSLGGVESLMCHPATMTHGPMLMNDEERERAFVTPGLIRFSVGLEEVKDLISDLKQALNKISCNIPPIEVVDKGIYPININNIGIIFYVRVRNIGSPKLPKILGTTQHCCVDRWSLNGVKEKSYRDCGLLEVLAGEVRDLEFEDERDIKMLATTLYPYDWKGDCNVSITYGSPIAVSVLIRFDTRISDLAFLPNFLSIIFEYFSRCPATDLDRFANCKPALCRHKYCGMINYFNVTTGLCNLADRCKLVSRPNYMLLLESNKCISLKENVTKDEARDALQLRDLDELDIVNSPITFTFHCKHGKAFENGTGCLCDPGWSSLSPEWRSYTEGGDAIWSFCDTLESKAQFSSNTVRILISLTGFMTIFILLSFMLLWSGLLCMDPRRRHQLALWGFGSPAKHLEAIDLVCMAVVHTDRPCLGEGELELRIGDVILDLERLPKRGLWKGTCKGQKGFFPVSCCTFHSNHHHSLYQKGIIKK